MREIQILDGNKLLADFMGLPVYMHCREWCHSEWDGPAGVEYDKSWDWIMPVCKKLDYLSENNLIKWSADYKDWLDKMEDTLTRTYEVEKLFPVVVEFVKWYNDTPTKIKQQWQKK